MIKPEYTFSDVQATQFLYRNFKKSEIENKIEKLRKQRENCDDYSMAEQITRKILRLKEELKEL